MAALPARARAWALERAARVRRRRRHRGHRRVGGVPRQDAIPEEMGTLVVDGDPPSASAGPAPASAPGAAGHRATSRAVAAPSPPPSSPRALAHTSHTLWQLLDATRGLSALMALLADALPSRSIAPSPSPFTARWPPRRWSIARRVRGALVRTEHLFYKRVSGTELLEERLMRTHAAPVAVRIALADGSDVDEVCAQLSPIGGDAAAAGGSGDGELSIGAESMQRVVMPVCASGATTRPVGAVEVTLPNNAPLERHERALLVRLVSAFGAPRPRPA